MVFRCKGCGRMLFMSKDEVRVGRFSGMLSFTVQGHSAPDSSCPWSGRIHIEGEKQGPEWKGSTMIRNGDGDGM